MLQTLIFIPGHPVSCSCKSVITVAHPTVYVHLAGGGGAVARWMDLTFTSHADVSPYRYKLRLTQVDCSSWDPLQGTRWGEQEEEEVLGEDFVLLLVRGRGECMRLPVMCVYVCPCTSALGKALIIRLFLRTAGRENCLAISHASLPTLDGWDC